MARLRYLQEDTYFRVLTVLEKNPQISQRALAKAAGSSLGGINYALRALIDKGLVKAQNFSKSDRKMVYAYVLTPNGLAEKTKLTALFLKRKIAEYEILRAEIAALQSAIGLPETNLSIVVSVEES